MSRPAPDRAACEGRLAVSGRREDIERIERRIRDAMERCGYDQAAVFAVQTALEEAISNAVHHGNNGDPAREVRLTYATDPRSVEIEVEDEGRGFDPLAVPDPTRPENVDIPCGRGIMLMRAYMTEVEFRPPGNRVRMRYVRKPARRSA